MAFGLKKVFSKNDEDGHWQVQDSETIPLAVAKEAFYRYLYSTTNSTSATPDKGKGKTLTVPQKLVVDVTLQSLQKRDTRAKAVPRLPYVIPKLLKSLRDPNSSAKDYVDIINKDPVMASAVLKLANSVYFNPIGRRIHEIDQAVVKLGIDGLRTVLSAAVMQPIIQKNSAYFSQSGQRIWQHSLTCAVACEIIAEHRHVEKFKVYVLGLIHDIGKITLFSELSKQFKINNEEVQPGYSAFVPALKKLSIPLSFWIAKDWEMSDSLCTALADQNKLIEGKDVSKFGHVLYQANYAAELYAAVYPINPKKAKKALTDLELPEHLFEAFEQLQKEI